MADTKHTAGPLHVFSAYAQHEVRTPSNTLVAVVQNRDDARLFAAAPGMLEALQALVAEWDRLYPNTKFSEHQLTAWEDVEFRQMQAARAAIANATGSAS